MTGADRGWAYLRAGRTVEVGVPIGGLSRLLPCHFHDDIQVTFVLAGSYAYRIGGEIIVAGPGQCVLIPPRLPHAPVMPDPGATTIVNAYVAGASFGAVLGAACVVDVVDGAWEPAALTEHLPEFLPEFLPELLPQLQALAAELGAAGRAARPSSLRPGTCLPQPLDRLSGRAAVAVLAQSCGCSREGFTRRFGREIGMPPHAYRLMTRLNRARALLRAGDRLVCCEAEAGFADQSHLGRHFRRAFGATPGAYRNAGLGEVATVLAPIASRP
jgi:AraC-like DNA-binding protein